MTRSNEWLRTQLAGAVKAFRERVANRPISEGALNALEGDFRAAIEPLIIALAEPGHWSSSEDQTEGHLAALDTLRKAGRS